MAKPDGVIVLPENVTMRQAEEFRRQYRDYVEATAFGDTHRTFLMTDLPVKWVPFGSTIERPIFAARTWTDLHLEQLNYGLAGSLVAGAIYTIWLVSQHI